MTISVAWDVEPRPLADVDIQAAAHAAAVHGGQPELELAIVLVDEEFLCDLHLRFLDDPSSTDVITFDLGEGPGPEGEVYVSVDRAREVSTARGTSLRRELALYVVHGVLHLCGFDDQTDRDRIEMRAAECAVLGTLGYENESSGEHEWS
ncbi:MAG: rRNA maturation RNase YbeY [Planctomycetota bacterium]|nr:rRNA maturation RNase YbeY [Planctomycetota bacterium]